MIEATKAYKTADGKTHGSLTDAKRHELINLLANSTDENLTINPEIVEAMANVILRKDTAIIEILKTKERIRAKKGTGTRKPRKGNQPALIQ